MTSKIYGLIGEKLEHTISPQIHSKLLNKLGINGCYNTFEIKKDKLREAITGLRALGVLGVNVTIPYKVLAIDFIDSLSSEARKIGAINTIKFDGDKAYGFNTDYMGFGMLTKKYEIKLYGETAVILGTGGASKAVVNYLIDNGVKEICMVSRNKDKFENITVPCKVIDYKDLKRIGQQDILINCTPCGMYPNINDCAVDEEDICKFNTVIDIIYNPQKTRLLKFAETNEIKAVNGLYMLIGQAIASEEIWNDVHLEEKIIDDIYDSLKELL